MARTSSLGGSPGVIIPGGSIGIGRPGWIAAGAAHVLPAIHILTLSTAAMNQDALRLAPFRFDAPGTATHICFENTSGTRNSRVGLYQVTASAISLMSESADTALGGTGFQQVALATPQTVLPGITYLAGQVFSTGAMTLRTIATSIANGASFPVKGGSFTGTNFGGWAENHTYGALPSTLTLDASTADASTFELLFCSVKMSA